MPVFWKPVVVVVGLLAAYNSLEASTTILEPQKQQVAVARNIADSPLLSALSQVNGVNTWRAVLTRSEYALANTGPVTMLVPSDASFAGGDEGALNATIGSGDPLVLQGIVRQTIIAQPLNPANLAGHKLSATTLAGTAVTFDATGQSLMVGDAEVLAVQRVADGSIIFIVDQLPGNGRPAAESDDRERGE